MIWTQVSSKGPECELLMEPQWQSQHHQGPGTVPRGQCQQWEGKVQAATAPKGADSTAQTPSQAPQLINMAESWKTSVRMSGLLVLPMDRHFSAQEVPECFSVYVCSLHGETLTPNLGTMRILSDTTQVSPSGESLSGSNQEFLIHIYFCPVCNLF